MTELERTKRALEVVRKALVELAQLGGGASIGNGIANLASQRVVDILTPEPEYEEVEVIKWMLKSDGTVWDKPDFHVDNYVKLTGTLRRPKPRKVEKSVSVEAWVDCDGDPWLEGSHHSPFRSTEAADKTGTLTFTWTEEEVQP